MIIDAHNHLGISPDGGEGTVELLLGNMRKYGIAKSVVFASDEKDAGFSFAKTNDKVIEAQIANPGKIIAFARITPSDEDKAQKEFHRCLNAGARGLKMKADDGFEPEQAKAILECVPKGRPFPVMLHTSHVMHSRPNDWEPLIKEFGHLNFILAHGGKDCYRDCARIVQKYPNVYVDTTTLSFHRSRYLYRAIGADKILFASDFPYSHPVIELLKFQLIVKKKQDLDQILFENAKILLGL